MWKNIPPPFFEEDSSPLSYVNIAEASDDDKIGYDGVVKIVHEGGINNDLVMHIAAV